MQVKHTIKCLKKTAVKKEKDPKRVEAGKRLPQLKERKIQQLSCKEQQGEIDDNKISINYGLILNAIGFTVTVISLYYVMKECERRKPASVTFNKRKTTKSPGYIVTA